MKSKADLVREIESARAAVSLQGRNAMIELSPRNVVRRSFVEHKMIWIGAAAALGTGIVFHLTSKTDKNQRDNPLPSAKKGGLAALLLTPLGGMLRNTVVSHGRQWILHYLNQHLSHRQPPVESD